VEPPPADALLKNLIRHVELNDAANLLAAPREHLVQAARLLNSAGEAVEDEAFLAVVLQNPVLDDADDNFVGHQPAAVHDCLRLQANLRASCHRLPEHVARGEAGRVHLLHDLRRLRALASARGAEEDQDCPCECCLHLRPDLLHVLVGVHADDVCLGLVVGQDGLCLVVVALQPRLEGLRVVVGALHERLAGGVVLHVLGRGLPARVRLRRGKLHVVGAA